MLEILVFEMPMISANTSECRQLTYKDNWPKQYIPCRCHILALINTVSQSKMANVINPILVRFAQEVARYRDTVLMSARMWQLEWICYLGQWSWMSTVCTQIYWQKSLGPLWLTGFETGDNSHSSMDHRNYSQYQRLQRVTWLGLYRKLIELLHILKAWHMGGVPALPNVGQVSYTLPTGF